MVCLIIFVACDRSTVDMSVDLNELGNISYKNWSWLAERKIFFAHQSVGENIIEGIILIQRELPGINLEIKEISSAQDFRTPIFGHAKVGKNFDPFSKCDDFKKMMESGLGDKVDIAFMKMCYVDVIAKTDVDELFRYYTETMGYLEKKYPKTIFVHFTVPLTISQKGWKVRVKRLLHKPLWDDEDNIKRFLYNEKLREKYGASGRLFELAEYESTWPDGSRSSFYLDGKKYFNLVSAYAWDEGHLTEMGKRWVGGKLLGYLQGLKVND